MLIWAENGSVESINRNDPIPYEVEDEKRIFSNDPFKILNKWKQIFFYC